MRIGRVDCSLVGCQSTGARTAKVLTMPLSGDVTGDYSSVVGYGAAVILKTK